MNGTPDHPTCPTCGTAAAARFCGHCGALVRPRGAHPVEVEAEEGAEGAAEPAAPDVAEEGTRPAPQRRRRLLAGAAAAVAVGLVATQLLRPTVETVTLGGEPNLGAGGTGVTSNVAVTDLTRRWQLASHGVEPAWGGAWFEPLASSDGDLLLQRDDELTAIDPTTGAPRWRLPGIMAVDGASTRPLRVLAGDELVTVDPETGAVTERRRLAARVGHEQLAVAVGDLIVASAPPMAFDADTGEVRWSGVAGWLSAVDGHHGLVRGDRLRVLDLRDGSVLLELPPPASGWQGAAFVDGTLVVADTRVTALDPATGRELWQADDRQPSYRRAGFRVSDGVVITEHEWSGPRTPEQDARRWSAWDARGEDRGEEVEVPPQAGRTTRLLAQTGGTWLLSDGVYLDAVRDGVVQWRRQLQPHQVAGHAGVVVTASGAGVTVLDAATGEQRSGLGQQWHQPATRHTLVGGCVVLAQARLETARLADGEPCWAPDRGPPRFAARHVGPGEDVVVVQSERGLQAYDRDGEEVWTIGPLGESVQQPLVQLTPRWHVLVDHDRLQAFPPRADDVEPAIRLLDTRTGDTDIAFPIAGEPWGWVGRGDLAAVRVHDRASGETRIELWELPTRDRPEPRRRWTTAAGNDAVTMTPDAVVVTTSTTRVELALTDGSVRRRVELAVRVGPLRAHHHDVLVAATGPDRLVGLDAADGALRWELALPDELRTPPTIAGDVAYLVVGGRTVLAVRVTDGEVVGEVELEADVAGAATAAGGRLLVPTETGLEAFGPELAVPAGVSSPAGRRGR